MSAESIVMAGPAAPSRLGQDTEYSRTHFNVKCKDCNIVLNSGRHYSESELQVATEWATTHNQSVHPFRPVPATEQQWLGNAPRPSTKTTPADPRTSGDLDNMASDYLQAAANHQHAGERQAALAATQDALIALIAADAVDAGRGVVL